MRGASRPIVVSAGCARRCDTLSGRVDFVERVFVDWLSLCVQEDGSEYEFAPFWCGLSANWSS